MPVVAVEHQAHAVGVVAQRLAEVEQPAACAQVGQAAAHHRVDQVAVVQHHEGGRVDVLADVEDHRVVLLARHGQDALQVCGLDLACLDRVAGGWHYVEAGADVGHAGVQQRGVEPVYLAADVRQRGGRRLVGHQEGGVAILLAQVHQQHALLVPGGHHVGEVGRHEGSAAAALAGGEGQHLTLGAAIAERVAGAALEFVAELLGLGRPRQHALHAGAHGPHQQVGGRVRGQQHAQRFRVLGGDAAQLDDVVRADLGRIHDQQVGAERERGVGQRDGRRGPHALYHVVGALGDQSRHVMQVRFVGGYYGDLCHGFTPGDSVRRPCGLPSHVVETAGGAHADREGVGV
ncbi:hypothetical protein D3C81_1296110 [compost metagenome]